MAVMGCVYVGDGVKWQVVRCDGVKWRVVRWCPVVLAMARKAGDGGVWLRGAI
ncbi:hypothetical protein Hdeb2414_s0007g00242741 [Helianthus debilis subsp. tardiflorus]